MPNLYTMLLQCGFYFDGETLSPFYRGKQDPINPINNVDLFRWKMNFEQQKWAFFHLNISVNSMCEVKGTLIVESAQLAQLLERSMEVGRSWVQIPHWAYMSLSYPTCLIWFLKGFWSWLTSRSIYYLFIYPFYTLHCIVSQHFKQQHDMYNQINLSKI